MAKQKPQTLDQPITLPTTTARTTVSTQTLAPEYMEPTETKIAPDLAPSAQYSENVLVSKKALGCLLNILGQGSTIYVGVGVFQAVAMLHPELKDNASALKDKYAEYRTLYLKG